LYPANTIYGMHKVWASVVLAHIQKTIGNRTGKALACPKNHSPF
jgi:hypothetical protein